MSELQEIDVVILPNGQVKVEVRGVKGSKCEAMTKPLEALLGGKIVDRERTDEYFEQTDSGELDLSLDQS